MGNYSIFNIFTKEPVAIAGAARAIIYGAVLLGTLDLTVEQLAGIAVALELALGLLARQSVTPNSKLP